MPNKDQKEELARVRERFNRDLAKLRKEYANTELAQRSGIDPANLSSYGKGSKSPGIKVLNQFYLAFTDEIENPLEKINTMENKKSRKGPTPNTKAQAGNQKQAPDYNHNDPGSERKTEEPATVLLYKDQESLYREILISQLQTENQHLRSTSDKMLDNSDKLFQLPYRWLDSMDKSNQITLTMVETHKMMIAAVIQNLNGKDKPN